VDTRLHRIVICGYGYIHGYPRKICGYGYGYGCDIISTATLIRTPQSKTVDLLLHIVHELFL